MKMVLREINTRNADFSEIRGRKIAKYSPTDMSANDQK